MSNGDKKTTSIDLTKSQNKLNPITSLPDTDQGFQLPPGIETLSEWIKYGSPVSARRYHTPTVFNEPYTQMKNVDWNILDPQDISMGLANRQSGWKQTFNTATRMVIGEIFGGMLEGFGSIPEILESFNNDHDFQTGLGNLGRGIREWTEEVAPIYARHPGKEWDPGDGGWWASNLVSVASTISLLIPSMAAVKTIDYTGKALRMASGLGKGSRYAKVAKASKMLEQTLHLNKNYQRIRGMIVGGTAMRHMENYREAAETAMLSYQKNFDFFANKENMENFFNTEEGARFLRESGLNKNSIGIRDAAARWIGSQAAAHSYRWNWANWAFDILQYGFIMGKLRGTRGMGKPTPVRAAQNAMLKNPKIPKTKIGKLTQKMKPGLGYAAWAYSEGIEEQWNYLSMMDGIRKGDIISGNTGWENPDYLSEGTWHERMNKYATHGGFWAATLMGTIGGGIFIGAGSFINRKANAEYTNQRIKEIGQRTDFIQTSLEKRQAAYDIGDTIGVEEQNQLLALNLGINASMAGNVDLLIEQINDPAMDELMLAQGVKPEELQETKTKLIENIEKTEKTFRKYYNRIGGKKFGVGVASAVTNLELSTQLYNDLINQIDEKVNEDIQNDVYSQDKFKIGINTRKRFELLSKRKGLNIAKERAELLLHALENDKVNEEGNVLITDKKEKAELAKQIIQIKEFIQDIDLDLQTVNKEEADAKTESQETYEDKTYREEEAFLDTVNTGEPGYLQYKRNTYKALRDASWDQLQKYLNEEDSKYFSDVEQGIVSDIVKEKSPYEKENVKMSSAIIDDFYTMVSNATTTEDQIKEFLAQYPQHQKLQTLGNDFLQGFIRATTNQQLNDDLDKIRKELAEELTQAREEVQDEMAETLNRLKEEIFNPKLNRKETNRRLQIEADWVKVKDRAAKFMYGLVDSADLLVNDLFDSYIRVVGVVWGDKIGALYRDENTNELIFREGVTNKESIVTEEIPGKKHRNTEGQFTKGPTLGYLNMVLVNENAINLEILEDGRTMNIQGEYFNNLNSNPTNAIEYDKEANVVSVTLTKWDGTKVTFTSPAITYELADVIETLDIVKRTQFEKLAYGKDFLVVEHNNKEYTVKYEQTDLFTTQLVARDLNGNQLTGDINESVLRSANIELSNLINNEIQIIKNKYNEAKSTDEAIISPVTETTLSPIKMGQSQTTKQAEEEQDATARAQGVTKNSTPETKKSKTSIETEGALLDALEEGIEVREDQMEEYEETGKIPEVTIPTSAEEKIEEDKIEQKQEQVAFVESTENTQSGKTVEENESKVIVNDAPTTTPITTLRRTYPWVRNQEFIAWNIEGSWHMLRDRGGMPIPMYSAPHGKKAKNGYIIKPMTELSPFQLEELEKKGATETLIPLHYFSPIKNKKDQVVKEGSRTIESNKLVPWTENGIPKVMILMPYAIKNSDIIRFDLANSDKVGVGTNVVLRVEPQWWSFMSINKDDVVVTIRLASNTNIIIGQLRASKYSAATAELRLKIEEQIKNNKGDIKATIAGKENGFIINLKRDGKSLKQPLSVLDGAGFDLVIGIGQDENVIFGNSDIQVAPSSYVEQGTVYLAIPTASGQYMSARAETENLSEESARKILDIISDTKLVPSAKRELVNNIVKVYPNVKSNRVLAMDEFVIKFPLNEENIIGLQYGKEGMKDKRNFQDALDGNQFYYKLYDKDGLVIPISPKSTSTSNEYTTKETLRNSETLNLAPGQIQNTLIQYLQTKKYNVQKHLINSKEQYFNPMREKPFKDYNTYLSEMNIVTTDIPGGQSQKFHSAGIYIDVADEMTQSSENAVPDFLKGQVEIIPTPEIITKEEQELLDKYDKSDVLNVDEETGAVQGRVTSIDSILGEETKEEKEEKEKKLKKIDPKSKNDDIDTEFRLRRYEELEGSYDLISETEKQWFLSRFGEEGLTVLNRIKYITLRDGRQAYGYYHRGMVTVAEAAKEGTIYWEAMRRIIDMHLTPEEKSVLFLEAQKKWGINSNEELETQLASAFMDYRLSRGKRSLPARIRQFFEDILYYIRYMLGMNVEIERLFRDFNKQNYTKFTKEELDTNSNTEFRGLREKAGYTSEQAQEITKQINFQLKRALQNYYKEDWMNAIKDPSKLRGAYESLRQHFQKVGEEYTRVKNSGVSKQDSKDYGVLGEHFSEVANERNWYDVRDDLGNIISPGFLTLAVKSLDGTFGVKYELKDSGEIDYDNVTEMDREGIHAMIHAAPGDLIDVEIVEEAEEESSTVSQERIHGVNFYHSPVKPTLAKDVKIELGFIQSDKMGKILGLPMFEPFDDVYAYLSLALSNTPNGNVVARLEELAKKGAHAMVPKVLELYAKSSPSWQNKFVSHFNKQNIQFKTLIIEDGNVKIVFTNRNGITKQIINDWNSSRLSSPIFIEQEGKIDLIDIVEVEKLREAYDKLLPLTKSKTYETPKAHKKAYIEAMRDVIGMVGIYFDGEVLNGLYNDDTIQISDLDKYMRGSNSFFYMLQALERGQSPYLASNLESGALNKFASLIADYKIDHYMSSFINGARKPVYAINLNTYDSKRTLLLRHEDTYKEAIMNYFNDVFYSPHETQRHLILDMLLKHEDVRNNFALSTFDVIKEKGFGGRATAYDNMSDNLSALTRFSMYYNSGLKYAEINTGTKGDKTQSKYIPLPKISPENAHFGLWKSGKRDKEAWINTAAELLKPLAFAEMARIAKTQKQLFGPNPIQPHEEIKNVHYEKVPGDRKANGLKFMFLRLLNNPEYMLMREDGTMLSPIADMLTLEDVQTLDSQITKALQQYVKDEIDQTLNAFVEAKVISYRESSGIYENINLPVSALHGKSIGNDITQAVVEFAINDLVYKPYLNTIFGPDLAFYKIDKAGNPIIDAGKRAYQAITPGIDPVMNENQEYGMPNNIPHAILRDILVDGDIKLFKEILSKAGVSEKISDRISNSYKDIESTDAQGVTTMEFHKQSMESEGTWLEEYDEAHKKYWSKGLMGDEASRKLLLDPRKTYYYGDRLITDSQGNETLVWEQIKHSTIPLVREFTELFKEDTVKGEPEKVTLNNLRQRMEGVGKYKGLTKISLVDFESGVKIGASAVGDIASLETLKVNYLSSKNLRTPQVITTKFKPQLDGTQWAKLILENIENNYSYNVFDSTQSGEQIKDLYNSIYAEKIKRSHDALIQELGWNKFQEASENMDTIGLEEFGKVQLKFLQRVRDVVHNSLEERDLPDNYYLALSIEKLVQDVNQYGFASPLSFPPFAKRFESILLSLFKNRVLKQRFKGMSVVQVAEFGWNTSKELKIKKHKNGGIYAEIALPYELGQKLGLKPGEIVDQKVLDPALLEIMGYRIPTQGKNSMLSFKIVRILPEIMGGIIMFPPAVIKMMGSDFDIDKMYLMFPEKSKTNTKISAFNINKFREKKSFEGVSNAALSNALFDIRQAIITSKHHVREVLDPLDSNTYQLKLEQYERLNLVTDLSNMNINSTAADMYLEKINRDANMLIGLFSLHSTGHALAQQMDVKLRPGYEINIRTKEGKSHTNLGRIYGFDGNYISSYISEDQNESLDNAKYQRIGRVGVSVFNHGVVALLNRTGFNNSIALDFINQPLIRIYLQNRYTADITDNDFKVAEDTVKQIGKLELFQEMYNKNLIKYTPSAKSLEDGLTDELENEQIKEQQTQLLSDFMRYMKASRDLSKFNRAVSPETLKNFSRLSFLEQYKNIVKFVTGPRSSISVGKAPARIEAYKKYGINAAESLTSNFIPYNQEGFLELKKGIAAATGQIDGILSPELTDVINSLGLYWSFTQKTSPFHDLFYNKRDTIKKRLFTKSQSLLNNLLIVRNKHNLHNDLFLGMLYNHPENVGADRYLQLIAFNNTTKLSPDQKNAITDRWAELLTDERADVRNLAQRLVVYSILTSGFMLGPNSFVDLVPMSYWKSSGLTEYFRKEARTMVYENYFNQTALDQIIRNIYTDQGLLMTVDKNNLNNNKGVKKSLDLGVNEYFLHKDSNAKLVVETGDGIKEFVKYFKAYDGKWRLYNHVRDTKTGAVYTEIVPLGERYKFVEMFSDDLLETSMHPKNTLKFKQALRDTSGDLFRDEERPGKNIDDIMPRLSKEISEPMLQDLDGRLETWLMQHFGIPVHVYDNLKTKMGIDAVGAADMLNRVVMVDKTRDKFTLPEEAAHFYIDMLEDKGTVNRLMELAAQTSLFNEVKRDYKHLYKTDQEFAKETAGQILGKYIVGIHEGKEVEFTKNYGTGIIGVLRKIWDQIVRFFKGAITAQSELHKELFSMFGPAAQNIVDGINPGGLSIENIGINKYYALQKSKLDLGSLPDMAKNLFRKGKEGIAKAAYLQKFSERDAMNALIAESNNITAPTSEFDNFYIQDGVRMNRVSRLMEIFQEPFEQQKIAEKIAASNRKQGNPFNTADLVIQLWDYLRDDLGTGVHTVMQGLIEGRSEVDILNSLTVNEKSKKAISKSIPGLRSWVRLRQQAGSTLYAEVKVGDKADLIAGTVDVIEVTNTGKKIIHDFKTKMLGKFMNIEQKLPSFKGPLASLTNTMLNKYRLQLSLYKYIIEEKGIKINEINIVPLEADVKMDKEGEIYFTEVGLAKSHTPVIDKLSNVQPIKSDIIKKVVSYTNADDEMSHRESEKEADRLQKAFVKVKNSIKLKIDAYERAGEETYTASMKSLYNELEEIGEKEGLVLYVKRARRDILAAHKRLEQLEKNQAVTPRDLNMIWEFVQAYDLLDEITILAPILAQHGYKNILEAYVYEAIAKKNLVYESYKKLGIPIMAKYLAALTNNPGMSEQKIEAELIQASRDIKYLARWLLAMGDSTDTVLANIDKMVMIQRGKVQRSVYKLEYGTEDRDGLYDILDELEKYQVTQGVNVTNNRELYDFMIETWKDGSPTGKVVTSITPEFRKKQTDFIKEKIDKGVHISRGVWNDFYAENKIEYSEKFKALEKLHKDNPKRRFYQYFKDNYKYANSLLPSRFRRGDYLPSLRASGAERLFERGGNIIKRGLNIGKEIAGEALAKHEDQIQWGEFVDEKGDAMDFVPIHYARRIGDEEGMLSPEDVSYALASSLKMFYSMAINHQQMQEIIHEVELTGELIKARPVTKLKAGIPIKDQLDNIVTIPGEASHAYQRFEDYKQMVVYGKRKRQEGAVTLQDKTINYEQMLDLGLAAGSLRVLAMNQHAALSNVGFGHLLNWVEAFAGQMYGVKNYIRAKTIYAGGIGGMGNGSIIADVIARKPSGKIGLVNELYNVLQNFDEYGTRIPHKNVMMRGMSVSATYFMMTAGEHMIQTQLAISMMLNKKFKTSKGIVNLWNSYSVKNGKLILDPEVADQFSEEEQILFGEKIQAVYQRMHGVYNTKDKAALQQYALGRWAFQFRKWLAPGAIRRFGGISKLAYKKESKFKKADWNERLNSFVEGNYVTAAKFINQFFREARQLRFFTMAEKYRELDKWQQANLKRALGEVGAFSFLFLLIGWVQPDDDEERQDMTALDWEALYVLKRIESELRFFSDFGQAMNIIRTPAANMTSIEAVWDFFSQLFSDATSLALGGDWERYKRKTGKYEKGDPKIFKYWRNILPFKEWQTDPKDKLKFFDLK